MIEAKNKTIIEQYYGQTDDSDITDNNEKEVGSCRRKSKVYQMVEEHTKYRFTLEEAINVLQSEPYMFENMVLHNKDSL